MELARELRKRVSAGHVTMGTFVVEMQTAAAPAILANSGFDWFIIDMEHGSYDPSVMMQLIAAGKAAGICPTVRIPTFERGEITRALDAGAEGILIPMVNSVEEVRRVVDASKYPPLGRRGVHFIRPSCNFRCPDDVFEYMAEANRNIITAVQIETLDAAELVDEIAAIDGVDMLYVGPGDLSVAMGHLGQTGDPQVRQVISAVGRACKANGKIAGCHCGNVDHFRALADMGIGAIGYSCELTMLRSGAEAIIDSGRKQFEAR